MEEEPGKGRCGNVPICHLTEYLEDTRGLLISSMPEALLLERQKGRRLEYVLLEGLRHGNILNKTGNEQTSWRGGRKGRRLYGREPFAWLHVYLEGGGHLTGTQPTATCYLYHKLWEDDEDYSSVAMYYTC